MQINGISKKKPRKLMEQEISEIARKWNNKS